MQRVIGIKFQEHGLVYYFDPAGHEVSAGDVVVVDTEQGAGIGRVVIVKEASASGLGEVKPVLRLATEQDLTTMRENDGMATEARQICREYVRKNSLDMKIIGVEVFFDRSKMIFYFTSPGRVDFRDLVKHLLKIYRSRIEMRQIGVRHETQMLGAIGNCGMVCCCRSTLRKFVSATIKMAKEQNLFLTPPKISGACGRLLCCLSFEQETYEDFHRRCPKMGKRYQTDSGRFRVLRGNMFQQSLVVQNEEGGEQEITLAEWTELHPRRVEGGQQEDRPAASAETPASRDGDRKRPKPGRQKQTPAEIDRPLPEASGNDPARPDQALSGQDATARPDRNRPRKGPADRAKRHSGSGRPGRDQAQAGGRGRQEARGGQARGNRDAKPEGGHKKPARSSGQPRQTAAPGTDQPAPAAAEGPRRPFRKRRDKPQEGRPE